ncbi:monovalent cation:proton antiporter-2 (CPA2) family protein [Erythrobacter sp. T5W1-R]|uniref:monovalent cation:proton antiporter-2 (CPA2) family protein n=1 Tax=Erythrobacter sp. T5W1-R TaxID=3101752 RepID=UPI002AFE1399|nr:monovalent cation:proton antiporter-2 (CPA2) family protein [Erythrobacter sp. T5W1-R]MEA1619341.1 monovalent cation:proton antiporter-2 (CPA2) family protein [Erythrobacter sp. T5W1-R]
MADAASLSDNLGLTVVLLASGVAAVPLFRRLGLGSVLGYFAAGLLVGPSVLGIFSDPEAILHVSELGVVMFLFLIGIELRPRKLWAMRSQIFGVGLVQVLVCMVLLTAVGIALGLAPVVAFVAGTGFVLSSTAVIMSVLAERGEIASPQGQQGVAILLLEDLAIVPLLALVAYLGAGAAGEFSMSGVLIGLGAIALLIVTGRWLLDPFFALLARARATEVLTAGALLVVLGSALLMERSGLSMALGAFLAGVLLSGSSYRHQIEADVEPFKGLLMGLFFLAVGMSLDIAVVAREWQLIAALLAAYVVVKSIGVFAVARLFGATGRQAMARVVMFAQGGEFAFVLYAAGLAGGVISAEQSAIFATVIILSMALTPLVMLVADRWLGQRVVSMDGIEEANGLRGDVLLIGFGRFGQIASQLLLARGAKVALVDNDPNRIRDAERFGFKVYFGDGARLDILKASGAAEAEVIMVCIDDKEAALRIATLATEQFPTARVLVRSYDRGHAIALRQIGIDGEMRETFESAIRFGGMGLAALGVTELEIEDITADIRQRDEERLALQVHGGELAGTDRLHRHPVPEPLVRRSKAAARE